MKPTAIIQLIVAASAVTHVSCVPWKKIVPHWNKLSAFAGTEGDEPNLAPRWRWRRDFDHLWGRWLNFTLAAVTPVTGETKSAPRDESDTASGNPAETQPPESFQAMQTAAIEIRPLAVRTATID
ncbi:hypothetical protein K456DRAFT_42726 [Colletotrichum gloeosporioides 23]|nr:hypothetical protein K456DRAFT_42726 [Colletotrichum gloeosporioides 23]